MPIPSAEGESGVARRRLYRHEAHDRIRDAILDGTLAPGEVLDDKDLRQWLGISRTPIRDALLALQIEGLVDIQAQSATRVVQPTVQEVEDSIQALGAIMGGVMRLAVFSLDDERRQHLVELADLAIAAVKAQDAGEHLEATLRLYEDLLQACPNETLVSVARATLVPLTFRYRTAMNARIPNWDLLISGWVKVRRGLVAGDNVLAELAFEEMHRLPLPDLQWDPAIWEDSQSGRPQG